MRRPRRAVSLPEVLVVIGVIGLLMSLLLPAIQHVRAAADGVACLNNLRQLAIAFHNHHAQHGRLPPDPHKFAFNEPQAMLSWRVLLAPMLEQDQLLADAVVAVRTGVHPYRDPPHTGMAKVVKVFTCPADSRLAAPMTDEDGITAAYSTYVGVWRTGTLADPPCFFSFGYGKPGTRFAQVTDGLSNTILLGERPPPDTLQAGQWYSGMWFGTGRYRMDRGPDHAVSAIGIPYGHGTEPCDRFASYPYNPGRTSNPCDRYHFWALHPRGGHFAFGDASARKLLYSARDILPALASRSGGEPVTPPDDL